MSSMVDKQEIIDMIRIKSPRLELVSFEAGKSEAWRWFKRVRVDGAVLPYAVCNGCFKPVHYTPRDGTGGLRRHACPLTVAMAQAKTGLSASSAQSKAPSPSPNNNHTNGKKRAETPEGGQQHSSQSPRSRQRRSATVPVSLTMWAAEKGLMDLTQAAAAAAGLPSGGLSIASAFAALQGIVPRWGAEQHHHHGGGGGGGGAAGGGGGHHHHHLPAIPHHQQQMDGGSPKMADSALDLAMKKSTSSVTAADSIREDEEEEEAGMTLDERHLAHHQHMMLPDRAQSIVDHILLNIQQQQGMAKASPTTLHDANQNEQTSRFSIMPPTRTSSMSSNSSTSTNGTGTTTRRPRKRSNPDRAIPTSNGQHRSSSSNGHPDIEANLQMLAQVANANDSPAVKRERISSPDPLDAFRYQMNGGQLTPTSQHSVPSPADDDGDHHHHSTGSSAASGGGRSTTGSAKSGASSPAHYLVNNVPASSSTSSHHHLVPSSSSAASTAVVESSDDLTVAVNGDGTATPPLRSQLAKPVESFVAAMHQVLQGSPQCSLAEAAQLIQLNDLTTCLHSLLDLHKKSLSPVEDKMPVPDLQKPAPKFQGIAVIDGQFKEISLDDYKGKYVVLFFYPLDFTFVCPTEILAFSDRAEEFRKIGCELIACSTDSHFCHLAWVNTARKQGGLGSLNIPLLADKSAAISKAYGVYKEDEGLSFRGLFIIDEQQVLRQVTINDLPVGRSVDETLRLVQAFQFTDKHGEVCPAGWTPGKKTMKADPAGSKEYFESAN